MACLRSLGTMLCIVAIFASSMLWSDAAHADRVLAATHHVGDLSIKSFAAFVAEASKRFGLSEPWIGAVLHVESGGKLQARSQTGAIGLMQIVPKTWTELTRSLWSRR
jgi:soluble lytic murein transglycosylase-like protein